MSGRTALHQACRSGRVHAVQLLLQMPGLDVNIRTCGGDSPLMSAVLSQQSETVRFCLENNFNPFLYNSMQQTPRDYAVIYSAGDIKTTILNDIDMATQ